jgi:hypothetical protein
MSSARKKIMFGRLSPAEFAGNFSAIIIDREMPRIRAFRFLIEYNLLI